MPENDCLLPTGQEGPLTSNADFRFMKVNVDKEVSGGVFGLAVGGSTIVTMRIFLAIQQLRIDFT